MSAKSRKQRGHLAVLPAASAFGLAATIARPGGSMKPFCEPATARSTPHSSMRKSMLAIELMPSTMSSAGWRAASSALRTPATSLVTPVAVSLWQTSTALILCSLSAARRCAQRSSGKPSPHSASIVSTASACRRHRSAQRCENWPKTAISTRSPGDNVLVIAASQPPVPEAGNRKTWPFSVLKMCFRSRNSGSVNAGKSGARWSSSGTSIAWRTSNGRFVGPGMKRPWKPGIVPPPWFSLGAMTDSDAPSARSINRKSLAERDCLSLDALLGCRIARLAVGGKPVQHRCHQAADLLELGNAEATGRRRRGTETDARRHRRLLGIERHPVLVAGDVCAAEALLGDVAGQLLGPQIQQDQVRIGAAGDEIVAGTAQNFAHGPTILDNGARVVLEVRPQR